MSNKIHQHYVYHLPRLGEMKKLFWEKSFDCVATNLVSIFIPIYLLKLHYPVQQIFWFYAITGLLMMLMYPLGFKSIVAAGANRTMVIGNMANAIFFLLLFKLPAWHETLFLLALFRGIYSAFYFPAFHANFIASRAHNRTGLQIGWLNSITLMLGGVAPAIGGIVASTYGIRFVYIVVVVSIVIANVPLMLGREYIANMNFRLKKIPWKEYKDFIANGLYNVSGFVESVIWPMAISLLITSYGGIGIVSSVMVLTAIFISLYVGSRQDRVGERPYINEGVATGAAGNIGKLLATTPIGIVGVNFISGTSDALLANSFTGRYYKNADSEYMLEYTFGMEVMHSIVWSIYFALLALAASFLSLKIVLLFAIVLAIPAIFGVRMIRTG